MGNNLRWAQCAACGPRDDSVSHYPGGRGRLGTDQAPPSFSRPAPDLQGKVLVRKNFAEYPPTGGKPALRHEDLMIVYREEGSPELQAIYFDNEGHVIYYSPQFSPDKKSLTFLSVGRPGTARFRLTYTKQSEGNLAIKFEAAPPGHTAEFKTYTEGTAVREPEPSKDAAKRE